MSKNKLILAFLSTFFIYGCESTAINKDLSKTVNNNIFNKEQSILSKNSFTEENMLSKLRNFKTSNNENSVKIVFCGTEFDIYETCFYGYTENDKNNTIIKKVNKLYKVDKNKQNNKQYSYNNKETEEIVDSFKSSIINDYYLISVSVNLQKFLKLNNNQDILYPVTQKINTELKLNINNKYKYNKNKNITYIIEINK